jgi:5-methylcytosine-specific restriction endonuclease McrA
VIETFRRASVGKTLPKHDTRPSRVDGVTPYTARWQRRRLVYLMDNPLCVDCKTADLLTAANVVDHIVPHRGDMNLFWSEDNWQPLCKRCHDLKTAQGL